MKLQFQILCAVLVISVVASTHHQGADLLTAASHHHNGYGGGGGGGGGYGGGGGGDGGHHGYHMYIRVPHHDHYEFGFKKGNSHHYIERHEQRKGPKFHTTFHWGDKDGHGEHHWDYNHDDHHHHHGNGGGGGGGGYHH